MPFTVVTLKKTPNSLRGDLTKWMQEISPGVYIGNFNSKIREELWKRIKESIHEGEATISYTHQNEIGYDFKTLNTTQKKEYSDGIPLVFIPKEETNDKKITKKGFSDAARYHNVKKFTPSLKKDIEGTFYIVLDIETTGLDYIKDDIIEIGALKVEGKKTTEFHRLIKIDKKLPEKIISLTGITDKIIAEEGIELRIALEELLHFIGKDIIAGYNIRFDIEFINKNLEKLEIEPISNNIIDIMKYVKNDKILLSNYKLETVLKEYEISDKVPHRALEDARLIYQLGSKLNKFLEKVK